MEYVLSSDAREDVKDIAKYLASEENEVMKKFLKDLRESCKTLTKFPEIAPLVSDKMKIESQYTNSVRFWQMSKFKKYTIFYIKENSKIVLIRILHNKRNAQVLFQ